jgi:hypothetical protein
MNSRMEDRSPERSLDSAAEGETRWGTLLQKVVDEQRTDDPWYVRLGISAIWSVAISLAAGLLSALVLAIRSLISANLQFTLRSLSDHIFWAAALLMILGMVSPSATDLDRSRNKDKREARPRSMQERRTRALERRMRRVYDPWRWRIWGGAALTFVLAIVFGMLTRP